MQKDPTFKTKAREVEEAVKNGTENVLKKMQSNIDFGLRWLEKWELEVDDLKKQFPAYRELLIQRRMYVFSITS